MQHESKVRSPAHSPLPSSSSTYRRHNAEATNDYRHMQPSHHSSSLITKTTPGTTMTTTLLPMPLHVVQRGAGTGSQKTRGVYEHARKNNRTNGQTALRPSRGREERRAARRGATPATGTRDRAPRQASAQDGLSLAERRRG
eukprot:CAMPEP_0183340760 /NCGR_PEP_ID=MMETSP0164_2-20130417/7199_1 /TAXON_ID=221442 /ORGANISM="Coccolithus pelagicus ssp braarudi, Strain PLY182g" /LENGTH=141 /DNA_ID=CAMNT_0025510945 /DNA_START=94 /DNA_END=515 /DNA_ORIENTATION=+